MKTLKETENTQTILCAIISGSLVSCFNKIVSAAFLVLIILHHTSCSKSPKCWGSNKEKGIITSSVDINCRPLSNQESFIIDNETVYKETFLYDTTITSNCILPEIDFSSSTLLGQYGNGSCEVKIIREVSRVEDEKRYHYVVTIKECGACKKLEESYNWVTVPKLPDGWTVTFEVKNK